MKKFIPFLFIAPYPFLPEQNKSDIKGIASGFVSSFSAIKVVAQSIYDYQFILTKYTYNTEEYHYQRGVIHQRVADRILKISQQNQGVYLKAGQYIGNLERVMPKEFTQTLRVLQDQGPQVSFKEITIALEYELGQKISDVFSQIDQKAIAAASLAQVHRGRLKSTNQDVAIKVQFPKLRTQYRYDLMVIHNIAKMCDFILSYTSTEKYNFGNIFATFRRALEQELDFNNEAKNGIMTANLFKDDRRVYVPEYYIHTHRVLVMEFIEGVKVTDIKKLNNPKECAQILIDTFAKMIFKFGHVHCDAHPGNLLVRQNPQHKNESQLVLLDHGFYTDIDDEKLMLFRKLWVNLAKLNYEEAQIYASELGVQEAHLELLPLIFFYRTITSNKKLGEQFTQEERNYLRSKDIVNLENISSLLQSLPEEIMFIIRAANLVGIHNALLGGTTRDRLLRFTRVALDNTYTNLFQRWYEILKLKFILFIFETFRLKI